MKKSELQNLASRLKATGGNPSAVESIAAEMQAIAVAMPDDAPEPVKPVLFPNVNRPIEPSKA